MFSTLIDVDELQPHIAESKWIIVDCRFGMADTAEGRRAYEQSHIPGAVYAHLDDDLSGPPLTDNGRHPLPSPQALVDLFSRLGIDKESQVVVYDSMNGALASRLWWMVRYMGHTAVSVLNGGWQAWEEAGFATKSGNEMNEMVEFSGSPRQEWLVQMGEVAKRQLLIDSRAPERYRGEVEPIDPVAGHIPGAINYFYQQHWGDNGRYLSPETMRANLETVLGDTPVDEATFYCGSGVTACVNLLALVHAGMGNGRLYVGSWSEWSRGS